MRIIVNHLRANAVAYLALFVALGGTSYAAVTLHNHSITPIKLNKQRFGGYVRAFASVEANGRIDASSPGARVVAINPSIPGLYQVSWARQNLSGCSAQAGLRATLTNTRGGSAVAGTVPSGARRGDVGVQVTNQQGAAAALPFFVDVVCPTP